MAVIVLLASSGDRSPPSSAAGPAAEDGARLGGRAELRDQAGLADPPGQGIGLVLPGAGVVPVPRGPERPRRFRVPVA